MPTSPSRKLHKLFQSVNLVAGETASAYRALLASIASTLNPTGAIEMGWVRDIADSEWDLRRLTTARLELLAGNAAEGRALPSKEEQKKNMRRFEEWCENVRLFGQDEASRRLNEERAADAERERRLRRTLPRTVLGEQLTGAYKENGSELDRIARLIILAEERRSRALRELERHRERKDRRGRLTPAIIDADFTDIGRITHRGF
jgi:hypothetical protein